MKHPLLIATTNAGKLREFRALLSENFTCAGPLQLGKPAPDVIEDGITYYENALKKAVAFQRTYDTAVLADDSGLEVDVLKGAPGIFSARFGGESLSWAERWAHLYRELSSFAKDSWRARFRCVLCYLPVKGVPIFFEAVAEGSIAPQPRGDAGFGYDPIFFSRVLGKTFGEATAAEKEAASHRSQAVREFLHWAQSQFVSALPLDPKAT